jgi:hypothetical protein
MVPHVGVPSIAMRATIALAVIAALAGCGSSLRSSSAAQPSALAGSSKRAAPGTCAATVLEALVDVARHVYHEGVASERTGAALHSVKASQPLREAVERGDAHATTAAAEALVAAGRMTNLQVSRGGRVLADVGGPGAVAPLRGTLTGATGASIGSFVTSVWAESGIVTETDGITEGLVALRANGRSIGGSFALPPGELPAQGTRTRKGIDYQYTSFAAEVFPSGAIRVYLFRPIRSTVTLCGPTEQDTVVNTISRVATLIYLGEAGRRALSQVRRVQHDPALLRAVSRRDPAATQHAIVSLLNQHIVRLRVSVGGRLLSDVGGPLVLAPIRGALRLGGRTIGSFVLSIQDDEGYLRLAKRLVGLDVLMYMGSQLVKNSLGPSPAAPPAAGSYRYRGHTFNVFTLHANAFPSGPLRIAVLIPIPYS